MPISNTTPIHGPYHLTAQGDKFCILAGQDQPQENAQSNSDANGTCVATVNDQATGEFLVEAANLYAKALKSNGALGEGGSDRNETNVEMLPLTINGGMYDLPRDVFSHIIQLRILLEKAAGTPIRWR